MPAAGTVPEQTLIQCGRLTTCNALQDGEIVQLDFTDTAGSPISLRLSFEQAESIAMTLPRLLTRAVRAQTGEDNARYVFPLGQWFLEAVEARHSFILTLKTADGFEVSFRVPLEACQALGWTLHHEAKAAIEMNAAGDVAASRDETSLN